jgi:class 3 adenylate cyclase
MSQSRQLAAIMFTDIVGYTALMGHNEQKAFELLRKNREIQKPIIEELGGRWIKELGDGVMASFPSVSNAVYAAIKIQNACFNSKVFELRIGIHLGEVVFENDDIFGDAVNIASRLQVLAPPAGIFVSESVQRDLSNKNDIRTEFVRVENLKNVKDPVRVYQIFSAGNEGNETKSAMQSHLFSELITIFISISI